MMIRLQTKIHMKKSNKMKILNPLTFGRKNATWALTLVLILTAIGAHAQAGGDGTGSIIIAVSLVAIVSVLVLLVAIYTLQVLKVFVKNEQLKTSKETGVEVNEEPSLWQKFLDVANNRAPIEKEADILLDHNYDGIRELDNHLPPWWKWLFYVTIIFGVFYVVGHHFTDWFPLQGMEYEIEMAVASLESQARGAANTEAGGFDESMLVYSDDATIISAGAKTYSRNCVPCHGASGEGNTIGPNLTDNYWLHGGEIKDVYTTIKEGVPAKGMISWKSQLSPTEIRDVATYILSLSGSNPPNAKAPQGTLKGEAPAATESVIDNTVSEEPVAASEEGKTVFNTTCVACHTADGGGVIGLGPNLTDKYWKNSNGSKEGIKGTITNGVAGTAMIAWNTSLSEGQIEAVTNYVLSLKGTTPANPKEPEGDLYE